MTVSTHHKNKEKLDKAELWMDEKSGEYFFRLEYICEDESETFRIIYPKVQTCIPLHHPYPNITHGESPSKTTCKVPFSCSYNDGHFALPDEKGNFMYRETILKKTYEMTLEENEKENCSITLS